MQNNINQRAWELRHLLAKAHNVKVMEIRWATCYNVARLEWVKAHAAMIERKTRRKEAVKVALYGYIATLTGVLIGLGIG